VQKILSISIDSLETIFQARMATYFYLALGILILVVLIFVGGKLLSSPDRINPIIESKPAMLQFDGVQFEPPFALHIVLEELIRSNKLTAKEAAKIGQDSTIGRAISQMQTKAEVMSYILKYINK
jgi:hypothetical protein